MATITSTIVGAKVTLAFEMFPLCTIGEVKQKITERTNLNRNRLTLRGGHNLEELEDYRTLEECRYRGEATIHLDVSPLSGNPEFDIAVGLPNNDWKAMKVRETTTVAELKDKIMERWGIPTCRMTLTRLDTTMEEDSSSLIDYYISLMGVIRVVEHETKEVVESEEGGET
ncbi:hypothetical protein Peur_044735 [Populus x canadensis]|jgi:hypothetical protein|uniref:Ubiquitin-like domain-containing protein n=1 Tax=Populus deltoides TaxID=3696 RepID=A0A8T2YLI6_POPDE|nr:hypothetical protein H0E87_012981 [Populus deltoides]